jgi:tRNA pseudouridine55 synthase
LNGILLINKPTGISSNAVLQRIRHSCGKPKAGHAGTLDPLATGMLPICFGQATKVNQFLLDKAKYYTVKLRLGVQTDTEDREGNIISHQDISDNQYTLAHIEQVLQNYLGKQQQIPPQFSALKHQGKPMYEYARKGIKVSKPAREITIHQLDIIDFDFPFVTCSVHCSKGTYIRSLVRDIGKDLGCGAVLEELHRDWSEPFVKGEGRGKNDGLPMLELNQCLELSQSQIEEWLLPIDYAIQDFLSLSLDEQEANRLKFGQRILLSDLQLDEYTEVNQTTQKLCRIYNNKEELIAIGEIIENVLKTKRLVCDDF